MARSTNRRHPMKRFLPQLLKYETWTTIDDPTALEIGDWVFNPKDHANYSGQIMSIAEDLVQIYWCKSDNNPFSETISLKELESMWWVDPCIQYEES